MSEKKDKVSDPGRRAFLTGAWLRRRAPQSGARREATPGKETVVLYASRCMAWQNTICMSCRDVCPEDAIVFDLRNRPTIDHDLCTDCGLCIDPCPTDAIVMARRL